MSTHLNVVLLSGLLPEHKGREERKPAQVDQSVEDTVLTEPLRHGVGLTRVAAAAVAAWKKYVSTLDCDLGPEHFKEGTTINSPHCQEFMV